MSNMLLTFEATIRIRLLYTALIDTVLIAWNNGHVAANPNVDIRALSVNHHLIFNALIMYFCEGTDLDIPDSDLNADSEYVLPPGAEQLIEQFQVLKKIHYLMKHCECENSKKIVGNDMFETIANLIKLFEI